MDEDQSQASKQRRDSSNPENIVMPEFNVGLGHVEQSVVSMCNVGNDDPVFVTRMVSIPYITNGKKIKKGQPLIMKVQGPVAKPKPAPALKRTWREEEKACALKVARARVKEDASQKIVTRE